MEKKVNVRIGLLEEAGGTACIGTNRIHGEKCMISRQKF